MVLFRCKHLAAFDIPCYFGQNVEVEHLAKITRNVLHVFFQFFKKVQLEKSRIRSTFWNFHMVFLLARVAFDFLRQCHRIMLIPWSIYLFLCLWKEEKEYNVLIKFCNFFIGLWTHSSSWRMLYSGKKRNFAPQVQKFPKMIKRFLGPQYNAAKKICPSSIGKNYFACLGGRKFLFLTTVSQILLSWLADQEHDEVNTWEQKWHCCNGDDENNNPSSHQVTCWNEVQRRIHPVYTTAWNQNHIKSFHTRYT